MSAFGHPDSHEIMRQIASETMQPVTLQAGNGVSLPKGWEFHQEDAGVRFSVPYHAGVMGGLISTDDVYQQSDVVGQLTGQFHVEVEIIRDEAVDVGHVHGNFGVYSGRIGGEIWKFFVFYGRVSGERPVFFYAVSPSAWFQTYRPVFEAIISSIQ